MPITPSQTIEIPAKPAAVADKVWVLRLSVNSPVPEGKARATITIAPYSSETNEMVKSEVKNIFIDDLFAEAAETPQIGAALQAVYDGVDAYIKKYNIL